MGGFLPRFATLYVVIIAYAIGTGDADVTCTDEAGNNLCQGLSSLKGAIEDRRAYDTDGEQDFPSGPMSAEIFPQPSFRLQHESSSARDMPLWLLTGLGLNKNSETVTLFRGPAGFAVVFVQPQTYAEEGQDANIAKGSYRQATTNSKQAAELNLGDHAKSGQPESSAQSQVQQQMAEWLAAKSRSQLGSDMAAPQVNSASDQQPQAGEQEQNSRQRLIFGVHQNLIQPQPLGAVSGGTAPQTADARAVVHQAWISNLQHHAPPVDNQHKQLRTGLWRIIGEKQHKPTMTGSLARHSMSLTGQPLHGAISWQYQQPALLHTSLQQEPRVASLNQNHIFQQGATPQQGAAVNVPSDYRAMLGHDASTGHISHVSEQHQHVAVTTTIIGRHPGQLVTETQSPFPIQQTQKTTAQVQQSTQPQQQASTNVGIGATLVERIAHQQQAAPKDNQQQSVRKPEELTVQTQQLLPATNVAQNTTQAPGVPQGTGSMAAPVAPQQAVKQEAVPSASTPPHELSATTTSPAQHQVTAQQPVVQGVATTKK
ncbi:uncharacterized protein LOC144123647 isoform X2 [Amblyomma americanum]